MKKLAFALITIAHKLKPYFQVSSAHNSGSNGKPIRKTMKNLKEAGRLVLWAIELSEFDVQYRLRVVIKAQALVDFIVELTMKDEA